MRRLQIGIIGSAGWEEYPKEKPNKKAYGVAYEIGRLIANEGAILVCGGKGGVMEAACRGAKDKNGITVGVIGGNKRNRSNKYIDIEVVSGFVNCGEDAIIISMTDGIIAIGGGSGTLQEIATAYRNKKPIVVLKGTEGWTQQLGGTYLDERRLTKIEVAETPAEAVELLITRIKA